MPNSQKKYANISTLQTFLENLKNTFSSLGHKHTISDITDYKVDDQLSSTSTAPVQNKVITTGFTEIENSISELEGDVNTKLGEKSGITHNHDSVYDTKGSAQTALESAKTYADSIKENLLNGAGAAYDTLKELGDLIDENSDAVEVLNTVAAGKADKEHSHADLLSLVNSKSQVRIYTWGVDD